MATIGRAAYEALLPSGELRSAGWEVPGWFGDPVWLIRWTTADLDRAAAAGIPAKVLAGARRHGLSAYLGGGPLALDRLHTAETTHPLGHALVCAAADWRRVGVSSPVPRPVLVALGPVYLDTGPERPKVDQEAVRHGLEWATTLINDSVALLEQANGGYSVLDYALDFLISQHPPIPAQAWDAALEHADPGDLVLVGYQAATKHDRFDVAESAWCRSAAHGEAYAMFNLGVLLDRRGEKAEAEQWYRKAAGLNHADAMSNLGVLLDRRGENAEAEQWYRKAAEVWYPDSFT